MQLTFISATLRSNLETTSAYVTRILIRMEVQRAFRKAKKIKFGPAC